MANQIEKLIAQTFQDMAQGLETGSFGRRPKIALTAMGSEHGEQNALEGALLAAKHGVDVVLIGSASLKAQSPVMLDTCRAETERLTGKQIHLIPLTNPPASGALIWAAELAFSPEQVDALRERIIAATRK